MLTTSFSHLFKLITSRLMSRDVYELDASMCTDASTTWRHFDVPRMYGSESLASIRKPIMSYWYHNRIDWCIIFKLSAMYACVYLDKRLLQGHWGQLFNSTWSTSVAATSFNRKLDRESITRVFSLLLCKYITSMLCKYITITSNCTFTCSGHPMPY